MAKVVKERVRGAKEPRPIYAGLSGGLARVWDGVVGLFSPTRQRAMRESRMRSEALLAFEAAVVDRMMPREETASADAEVLENLPTMRARSRRQVRNDGHAESATQTYVDAVVGPGVKPQPAASSKTTGRAESVVQKWRDACSAYFEQWSANMADASGHGTFYDMQQLVARTRKVDGDCFTHTVVGGDNLLTVEVIDADRVDDPMDKRGKPNVRGGVKIDAKGRPLSYYIAKQHPDDVGVPTQVEFVEIPAAEGGLSVVQHHFRRNRVGQTRGYPDSAPAAQYLEHLHHYLKSEIIGARAAANYAMFIKKAVSAGDAEINPMMQASENGGTETVYHERLEAGTIAYLNEGEEPVAFNPNRPGAGDEFVKRMLRAYGGSQGMSYERLARDYGGMNYSSMRGLLKEEQRGFDRDRALLCRQFCTPVYRNVIRHGIQTGALVPPPAYLDDPEPWLAVRWIPPAMGWVDPVKEIQAARDAIDANLSTPWHEAGRAGLDPLEVLEDRARFLARAADVEAEYGLAAGSLTGGASASNQSGQGDQPATSEREDDAEAPSASDADEQNDDEDAVPAGSENDEANE